MNLHILVPCALRFHLFRRSERGALRQLPGTAETFAEALESFHHTGPRWLIVLGIAYPQLLPQELLENTCYCLIPEPWLRHIAPHHVSLRAEFAAQLFEACLHQPIRIHRGTDSETPPSQAGVPILTNLATPEKRHALQEIRRA